LAASQEKQNAGCRVFTIRHPALQWCAAKTELCITDLSFFEASGGFARDVFTAYPRTIN
jgi:hypothetical protein